MFNNSDWNPYDELIRNQEQLRHQRNLIHQLISQAEQQAKLIKQHENLINEIALHQNQVLNYLKELKKDINTSNQNT